MSAAALELESPGSCFAPDGATPMTLIDFYLRDQQELTAVERFSARQDSTEVDPHSGRYSALLPAAPPREGEQYAFDVDLDACSGCKSCVTACHALNGLDEDETWRSVGLLHGGTEADPFVQHVTAACHHCLDPACLSGCPVRAYEKDEATGIVRHLDDQCIGCQYCIFACPYEVPRYNRARGIVRKCDMCSQRLAVQEAPACVQACPNGAIRIAVVSRAAVTDDCEAGQFLPGAPDPQITRPTTNYRSRRAFPRNALPADYFSVRPEQSHWPLIVMLVLTQLSVGAFLVQLVLDLTEASHFTDGTRTAQAVGALGFGLLALAASTLHLGRPLYAFRVVVGLSTSWLSREILAFGLFALLAAAYAGATWVESGTSTRSGRYVLALGGGVVLAGLAGVACSVLVYQTTRRALWSGAATTLRFLGTAVVLGIAASLCAAFAGAALSESVTAGAIAGEFGATLLRTLIGAASIKLLFEASLFRRLLERQLTPLKRSALLMTGELSRVTVLRFLLGAAGGIILPALLLDLEWGAPQPPAATAATAALLLTGLFSATLAGELLERYLFFTAVAGPRMPGGLRG